MGGCLASEKSMGYLVYSEQIQGKQKSKNLGQNKILKATNKTVNDVIADKNVVTKIMNNYTGLQRIELNGFAKRHWQNGYYP